MEKIIWLVTENKNYKQKISTKKSTKKIKIFFLNAKKQLNKKFKKFQQKNQQRNSKTKFKTKIKKNAIKNSKRN